MGLRGIGSGSGSDEKGKGAFQEMEAEARRVQNCGCGSAAAFGPADSNYATVIHVPADFAAQYEGPLYILRRDKKTGIVETVKQISSQEELDALPGDESCRDYKIYSNGTYGMSAGYQYAVAEKSERKEKEDGLSG